MADSLFPELRTVIYKVPDIKKLRTGIQKFLRKNPTLSNPFSGI